MSFVKAAEQFVYWFSSFGTGTDVDAICALESPVGLDTKNENDEDHVIAQVNGDLISTIEIRGARKFVGPNDLEVMVANFSRALEKLCKSGKGDQHSFSMGFRSDPDQSDRLIGDILSLQVQTAKRFGITNLRMMRDRRKELASKTVDVTVYLVVRTHKNALQPHERKAQREERQRMSSKISKGEGGQTFDMSNKLSQIPLAPLGALSPRHTAAVRSLVDDLSRDIQSGGAQLLLRTLSTHESIHAIRRHLDAAVMPPGWRPRLVGDKSMAAGSSAIGRGKEVGSFYPPRLSRQMMTSKIEDVFSSKELCRKDGIWYGSVTLEILPDDGSQPFHDLARRIGQAIPWRVSFEILPNGDNFRKMEKLLCIVLASAGDYNKTIRKGFDELKALKESGVYVGAMRGVFTTWGASEQEVCIRLANLTSSVESWGSAGCSNETGEPARAMLASAAGFANRSPANFLPAPMTDIARMMPFSIPASIWDRGQIVLTTLDGRPYPIEFGSTMQNYWSTIGFAPTGSGKSFMLNVLNSGLLLAPGAQEVPPITLVDVGLSGKLVMDWFRSILPASMQEQVLSISLRNSHDYIVNPFDTQPGFEDPLPGDVSYLTAVFGTIAPGCGPEADKFFERVIRTAYDKFGRTSPDSKRWQNAFDAKVCAALERIGFEVKENTRVWAVVDALFDAGCMDEFASAQRFAMPTMQDIPKIAASTFVANVYGDAWVGKTRLIDLFTRNVVAALDSYAIISGYTKFNIGAARAVSIDLQEVVGDMNSDEGKRRSGLMFLLARRIGARNYFLKWDEIATLCPPRYAGWQERRVNKLWETIKYLQFDEAHYFSGIESVVSLVRSDLRTGRKFNLITAMFSQLLDDFPPAVLENTYIFFILGLGDASPATVRDTFSLSPDEMKAIGDYCIRPGTMFGRFRTQKGVLSQIIRLNASAYEKWAFTTQGKDQALRSALSRLLPYDKALDLLTDRFPSGSAEPYLARVLAQRTEFLDANADALATEVAKILLAESLINQA